MGYGMVMYSGVYVLLEQGWYNGCVVPRSVLPVRKERQVAEVRFECHRLPSEEEHDIGVRELHCVQDDACADSQ